MYPLFAHFVSLQVISLRDQIKRRQQGVDGGKDVREGFMHVGSSCFCVCVSDQKVSRKVDTWVPWCVCDFNSKSYLIHISFVSLQPQQILTEYFSTSLSFFFLHCHHSSDYPMVPPLAWRIASWKDSEKER